MITPISSQLTELSQMRAAAARATSSMYRFVRFANWSVSLVVTILVLAGCGESRRQSNKHEPTGIYVEVLSEQQSPRQYRVNGVCYTFKEALATIDHIVSANGAKCVIVLEENKNAGRVVYDRFATELGQLGKARNTGVWVLSSSSNYSGGTTVFWSGCRIAGSSDVTGVEMRPTSGTISAETSGTRRN